MDEQLTPPPFDDAPAPDAFKPVSRRVATFWNMVFAYTFMGLMFVRQLLLVPLYLHYLGDREYSAWISTGGLLSYLMTDFGLLAVLLQQAATAFGQGDRNRLARLGGTGLVIALGLSVVTCAAGIAVSPIITSFFPELTTHEASQLTQALVLMSIANGSYTLAIAAMGLLRSLQRPFLSGLMRVVAEAVGIVVSIVLLMLGWGLPALGWGLIVRSVLAAVPNLLWLAWLWLNEFRIGLAWAWADAWALWRLSVYQFLTYMAAGLKNAFDPFLVAKILGLDASLAYVMTIRANEMVRLIVTQFSSSMLPSLSHLQGQGRREHFNRVVTTVFQLQTLVSAIGLGGVLIFNKTFVTLWVGHDRYAGMAVTGLITVYGLLYLTSVLAYEVLYAHGDFWQLSKVVWLDLVLRVPLMTLLIYVFGVWGATLGSVVGQAIAWNGLLVILVIRRLGLSGPQLRRLGRDTVRLTLAPLALAGVFWWVGGVGSQRLLDVAASGHKLQAWLQFGGHAIVYLILEAALAAWLAPHLLRVLRRRGRIDEATLQGA